VAVKAVFSAVTTAAVAAVTTTAVADKSKKRKTTGVHYERPSDCFVVLLRLQVRVQL